MVENICNKYHVHFQKLTEQQLREAVGFDKDSIVPPLHAQNKISTEDEHKILGSTCPNKINWPISTSDGQYLTWKFEFLLCLCWNTLVTKVLALKYTEERQSVLKDALSNILLSKKINSWRQACNSLIEILQNKIIYSNKKHFDAANSAKADENDSSEEDTDIRTVNNNNNSDNNDSNKSSHAIDGNFGNTDSKYCFARIQPELELASVIAGVFAHLSLLAEKVTNCKEVVAGNLKREELYFQLQIVPEAYKFLLQFVKWTDKESPQLKAFQERFKKEGLNDSELNMKAHYDMRCLTRDANANHNLIKTVCFLHF